MPFEGFEKFRKVVIAFPNGIEEVAPQLLELRVVVFETNAVPKIVLIQSTACHPMVGILLVGYHHLHESSGRLLLLLQEGCEYTHNICLRRR